MDDGDSIDGSGEGGITGVLKFAYESTLKDQGRRVEGTGNSAGLPAQTPRSPSIINL